MYETIRANGAMKPSMIYTKSMNQIKKERSFI